MTSRLRPLLILGLALLLLAGLLVLLPLRSLLPASAVVDPPAAVQPLPSLLLVTDTGGSGHRYDGLRHALSVAGIPSRQLIMPRDESEPNDNALWAAAESLRSSAGRPVWLLFEGRTLRSADGLNDQRVQGVILWPHTPSDLAADPAVIEWLEGQPLVLMTSDRSDLQVAGAQFFEKITGEDAVLFDASAPAGPDQIRQYRSVDGRVAFSRIQNMRPYWAPLDPRISALLSEEIHRLSTPGSPGTEVSHAVAGSALLTWLLRLILTGWGLIAVAALIRLYLAGPAQWSGRHRLPLRRQGHFLIWLPAAVLALALAFLLRTRWAIPISPLVFLLLPGAFGLISGSAASISGQLSIPERHADQPDRWLRLCGLLVVAASVAVLFLWQYLAGGMILSDPVWLLPLMVLWNLPGFFSDGRIMLPAQQRKRFSTVTLFSVLIWLLLLVWLWLTAGWPAAVTGLLMLVILDFAEQIGRLTAALIGWQFPGRLLRSLIVALVWLHPVVLQGLNLVNSEI